MNFSDPSQITDPEWEKPDKPDQQFIADASRLLVHRTLQVCAASAERTDRAGASRALAEIHSFLASNLDRPLKLSDLASRAGMSQYHFARELRRAYGVSPIRYHRELRVVEAKRLLRETGRSVSAIARRLGFSDLAHFSTAFKRYTGKTPSEVKSEPNDQRNMRPAGGEPLQA